MNKIGADDETVNTSINAALLRWFQGKILEQRTSLDTWLDVGCGGSWMRDRFESLAERWGVNFVTHENDLDVELYEREDSSVDLITSFEVLEHLYNPLFHMKELSRILKANGRLFLTTPNDYSLLCKLLHLISWKYRPHFHQFSKRDLEDLIERAGLKIVSVTKTCGAGTRIPILRWLSRTNLCAIITR